jgi:CheY-like chemotaxis protein
MKSTMASGQGPRPLEGVTIVLAEDDDDSREMLRLALEERGASLRCVTNSSAALDAIREQPPDVVVSDIGMPGEDGHAFMRKLRALPPSRGGRTPAVALTAYAERNDRLKSVYAGFHYHLTKPVDADKLVEILVGLVRLTRTRP